jgi:hypothetical protein
MCALEHIHEFAKGMAPHRHKLRDICDAALAAGGEVRVLLREQSRKRVNLRLGANAWMLSRLERNFDAGQYTSSIAPIQAETASERPPETASPTPPIACPEFIVNVSGQQNGSSAVRPQPKVAVTSPKDGLTAVIPAHNRVGPCP